eukprot:6101084-Pyramimonas_sp.AAC.1
MQSLDTLDTLHHRLRRKRCRSSASLPDVDSWAHATSPTPCGTGGRGVLFLRASWAPFGCFLVPFWGAAWGPVEGLLELLGGRLRG